jgi:hypothetical protein
MEVVSGYNVLEVGEGLGPSGGQSRANRYG